jgi:hypothetical protein
MLVNHLAFKNLITKVLYYSYVDRCGMHGGEETAFRVLVGKREGKRQLGRPGHKWEYNVKMKIKV